MVQGLGYGFRIIVRARVRVNLTNWDRGRNGERVVKMYLTKLWEACP